MATNSNGNSNGARNGNGTRKPVATLTVGPIAPKRLASAADHAIAAQQHSQLAAAHAGMAAARSKAEARKR